MNFKNKKIKTNLIPHPGFGHFRQRVENHERFEGLLYFMNNLQIKIPYE